MTNIVMQSMRWSSISDIENVEPMGEKDSDVLKDLYQVLKKHDCVERLGIFLIHKHFEINDDEMVVEYTDTKNRKQNLVVEKKLSDSDNHPESAIETAWKFSPDTITAVTVCVLRCNYNNGHKLVHVREAR